MRPPLACYSTEYAPTPACQKASSTYFPRFFPNTFSDCFDLVVEYLEAAARRYLAHSSGVEAVVVVTVT